MSGTGRPPTLPEAVARGLYVSEGKGVHTFSNGSHYHGWADGNCRACWFYDPDGAAGEMCAFEGAALLDGVSPDLARLFGWVESAEYPGSFTEPAQCPFFRARTDDDGNDNPPPPAPDPDQFVLLADPSEDASALARVRPVESPGVEVSA